VLACLIERVAIDVGEEEITGHIRWRSGAESEFRVLRRAGVHRWVLELNAQGLTVPEIERRLRQPHAGTGQRWTFSRSSLYVMIRRYGQQPNLLQTGLTSKAAGTLLRLRGEGRTKANIASEMNRLGVLSPKGRSWNEGSVRNALRTLDAKDRGGKQPKTGEAA
jgi:hypothetical protein